MCRGVLIQIRNVADVLSQLKLTDGRTDRWPLAIARSNMVDAR